MTRKQYEQRVKKYAAQIQTLQKQVVEAYWERAHSAKRSEDPEVKGVPKTITDACADARYITHRIEEHCVRTGEDWEWVCEYY